ncbi:MAG: hypothetical protein EOO20_04435 [Chryseobacterium sp.]|nr:MAG: hypothetical protein EOO20_04435 [Chryseobacterium sp.]
MESIKRKFSALMILVLLMSGTVNAQTWSEWFSQKKTQQKYLLEQVAALKLYAGYLKKGYDIGHSGLTFIKDASKGEFDLHGAFFSSLKAVSPEIRNNVKVAEIIQMQVDVSKAFHSLGKIKGLTAQHISYFALVRSNLLDECLGDMEELLLIITSGRPELTDDERLLRIDRLHIQMQEKRSFALSISNTFRQLGAERTRELETIKKMEEWYENR